MSEHGIILTIRNVIDVVSTTGLPDRSAQDALVDLYERHGAEWESCPLKNALEHNVKAA